MALVPKIDPNKIFASNAPSQDKPAAFDNYEKGMDETRKNLGRPTIPQLNYLHQTADQKILWIHQNGGGLPYDASIEYAEKSVTLKDGELKQLVDGAWVEVKTKALPATAITTASSQNQQQINDFGGAKWYAKVGGYELGATVKLANGDTVQSTKSANTANPNVDMIGWKNPIVDADALKQYATLALATSDIANIAVNQNIFVSEVANGGYWYKATAGATSLTKSPFDPLTQAKSYTDTFINKRNNLADNFLYTGVLTNADDLNPLTKDGVYVATSTPSNSPEGETGQALIKIERHSGFVVQTWQRIADSRRIWRRTIQTGQTPEAWRDLNPLGSVNIATASKVGTVKPSTGLTVGTDGALSVSGLLRPQLADNFTYVGNLNAASDLNTKLKEGSYLTVAAPLNAPTDININVLVTIQNVGQRDIQTIYDLVDSRKRLQRVIRFNGDGAFNSAEAWRDLYQTPRAGLADVFMYAGVLTNVSDLNTIAKEGNYLSTSVPINAPVGAPAIAFYTIFKAGSFTRQTCTDGTNATKTWTRTFQATLVDGVVGIAGGTWISGNISDQIASATKVGAVKVGSGLSITEAGVLSVNQASQANIFAGKKIVCFGDSITEFKTYPQQVGALLGAAEGINVGFGGCMMAAHWDVGYKEMCMYRLADYIATGDFTGLEAAALDVYTRTADDNRAIVARLAEIDWNTVDYITILYGTNDFANGKKLGLVTDNTPDGSSYLGSANYVVQRLLTRYPHLKIAFITPIYRARGENGGTDSDDSLNAPTNGKYLRDFCTGLIEVAKLNHIPCFNLQDESGINKYTASLYLNPTPDGVHLTETGATFLAQKIAAKIRANF